MASEIAPSDATGRPPAGWTVRQEARKGGGIDTHFVTRSGKKVCTMNEVHYHLKNELPASEINEDEELWLRTLERYGQNCRHWAIARSAHDLPECPTFRPTAAEFVDPGRYFESIMPQVQPALPHVPRACHNAQCPHPVAPVSTGPLL